MCATKREDGISERIELLRMRINDGRAKPDLVAPGTHIQAGIPQSNYAADFGSGLSVCDRYFPAGQTLYSWSSGTSHSTPAVAGGAALVSQDFLNKGLAAPSPAMIKAVLMNSATYLTGEGAGDTLPSNSQGMGRMDLGRAFDGSARLLIDQTRILGSSGAIYQTSGSIDSSDRPFRVTLAWTDATGSAVGSPWVNDLDLEVTINGQTYRGNVFSGANSIGGGVADNRNNVESVFLPAGVSGSFVVTVRASNLAGDGVPGNDDLTDQDFALVIYNANSIPPDQPLIGITPSDLSFTAVAGGNNPGAQSINIDNIGSRSLNWTASENASWLTLSSTGGLAPSSLTASVDATGLPEGVYGTSITISSTDAPNLPVTLPVTLTVLPAFKVFPPLLFVRALAGIDPGDQTITLDNNDRSPQSWTVSDDASWLSVNPASGMAPSTLTVSIHSAGLSVGGYTGTITIVPERAPSSPIRVTVLLNVEPLFKVTPPSLSFDGSLGSDNPPAQNILLDPGLVRYSYTASTTAPWLKVIPASGTPPVVLKVFADITGLAIGTYTATISINAINTSAPPVIVPVTLRVDRFINGGFEGSSYPWIFSGVARSSVGAYPRSGSGYLILGRANDSEGVASQELMLPPGSSLNLSFQLNVESSETTTTKKKDQLFVEIRDIRGRLLKTPATFSNLDRTTPGNYTLRGQYNLASCAGQPVRIQFRTVTDSASLTTFRIDDVQVK